MKRLTIEQVMTRAPHTIGYDQPLARAHEFMREHRIRHLPVLQGGAITGILSQRDLYFVETLAGVDLESVNVEEAMSSDVYVVSPSTPLAEVTARMVARKLGSAVVAESGQVVGVFTTYDALHVLSDHLWTEEARVQP